MSMDPTLYLMFWGILQSIWMQRMGSSSLLCLRREEVWLMFSQAITLLPSIPLIQGITLNQLLSNYATQKANCGCNEEHWLSQNLASIDIIQPLTNALLSYFSSKHGIKREAGQCLNAKTLINSVRCNHKNHMSCQSAVTWCFQIGLYNEYQKARSIMGCEQSKANPQYTSETNLQDDNPFILEDPEKVTLTSLRQVSYFWIDQNVYSHQNMNNYKLFQEHFPISCYTSLQALSSQLDSKRSNEIIKVITSASLQDDGYKQLQNDPRVAQMFLFCGNEERAKLLCHNFNKIRAYALSSQGLIDLLKKFEQTDQLQVPPSSLLFMLQEDRKRLNLYRFNHYCITTKHQRSKSKDDLVRLATTLMPGELLKIHQFQAEYNLYLSGNESHLQALGWAFGDSFYWQLVDALPKATTDPKKLAYLRLPFTDLFQAIFQRKEVQRPEQLYIVAKLSNEQLEKLHRSEVYGDFFMFTSFVKGYKSRVEAFKEFQQSQNSFLFTVTFTQLLREPQLDFGFVFAEDNSIKKNVLFNIFNFFKLKDISAEQRLATLVYGSLAEAFHIRSKQSQKNRLSSNESLLLKNYDYVQQLIKKDRSQAFTLQMSGNFEQSVAIYSRKVEYLRQIQAPEQQIAKCLISRGDVAKMKEDYEQAERDYLSVTHEDYKLVAQLHLLELYITKNDERQSEIISLLLQPLLMHRFKQKFPEEGFKADCQVALYWLRKGYHKEAHKKLKTLVSQVTVQYGKRLQGIPVVHDILKSMAVSQCTLNNHHQALNLLSSVKESQLACEGECPLTEKMIKQVVEQIQARQTLNKSSNYLNANDSQPRSQYEQSVVNISLGGLQPTRNPQYSASLNNSTVQVNTMNVNSSAVNVNLNPIPTPTANLNSSVVTVNINPPINVNNPPINVNNSSVNVNLNPGTIPIPANNMNNSRVDVDLNPPTRHNNTLQIPGKERAGNPVNMNHSSVDIKL